MDTISQAWLLTHIPMDKAILSTWLQAGYMDKSVLYETEDGTPQGGCISPVLANMALDGLETILRKKYPHSGIRALKGKNKQVNLVRYADGTPVQAWNTWGASPLTSNVHTEV